MRQFRQADRPARPRRPVRGPMEMLGLAAALGLALAACSSPSHPAARSGPTSSTSANTTSTTSSPTGTTTTPPASGTSTPAGSSNRCRTSQLSVALDSSASGGAAAGSVGFTYVFTNTSGTTCTLEGYPGLGLLDAAGHPIHTDVLRGHGASTVPPEPVTTVSMAPAGKAWFALGFADQTGYGSAQCPKSTSLAVTAPNAYDHLTITGAGGQLQPYGGTVQSLHCGQITVSPVLSHPPFQG
ncbi:MAG: DUF4232 domain-containing protein [Acidimicrobiales bacterium]